MSTISELNTTHAAVYDALASEYDQFANDPRSMGVVKEAATKLVKYVQPPAVVLDAGCAVGNVARALTELGYTVEGIDISSKMIELSRKNAPEATFYTGDICSHVFTTQYDAIVAFALLHLFPKKELTKILDKMKSILKSGGYIYTGTTRSDRYSEGFEHKEDYGGKLRRYRARWPRKDLDEFFIASGFEVVSVYEHTDHKGKVWMDYVIKLGRGGA